jgi:hypothetical protein
MNNVIRYNQSEPSDGMLTLILLKLSNLTIMEISRFSLYIIYLGFLAGKSGILRFLIMGLDLVSNSLTFRVAILDWGFVSITFSFLLKKVSL